MSEETPVRTTRRRRRWPFALGGVLALLVVLALVFRWDWLIPLVETRASAALGRKVTIGHLHVQLGRVTHITAEGVAVGNPAGWPGNEKFATVDRLGIDVDAVRLIKQRQVSLPAISVERPEIDAQQLADKTANWTFGSGSGGSDAKGGGSAPQIGRLSITDGSVHVRSVPLGGDFQVQIATKAGKDGQDEIVASAKGTYAKQPITAEFVGGALLSLQDSGKPYPVDLKLQNGPTSAKASGTIDNPLAFAGAHVRLELAGPDMSLLLPLTGVAIPKTPPYRLSGAVSYAGGVIGLSELEGKVGSTDLEGELKVDSKPARPVLDATLRSRMVNLDDLGGFIGTEPGDGAQKAKPRSDGRILPNEKLSLPRLNAADVHLNYEAKRIQGGKRQPLDNMLVAMDVVDGAVSLHPLRFGIGSGEIKSEIKLTPQGDGLQARADVYFQRVDVSKLLSATGVAQGAGAITGRAVLDGSGQSVAQMLARGSGELKLSMGPGGNLSALLVDLSGFHFGNALLSALGLPTRTRIECLITDVVLKDGDAQSHLTMLDTDEARIGITGSVDLRTEAMKLVLRTEAKHFTIGSLPVPIGINGTLGAPAIAPDLAQAGPRAAAAVGLGFINPLAALLPTIQTGTGEDGACSSLLREVRTPPRVPAAAPARSRSQGRRR